MTRIGTQGRNRMRSLRNAPVRWGLCLWASLSLWALVSAEDSAELVTKTYDLRELSELSSRDVADIAAQIRHVVMPETRAAFGGKASLKLTPGTTKIVVRQSEEAHDVMADWIEWSLRLAEREAHKKALNERVREDKERQRKPPVSTSELKRTDVTPVIEAPLSGGRNVVFGIVTELAWQRLQAELGGPVELVGNPEVAKRLNGSNASAARLDPACYLAVAGKGPAAIERLRLGLAEKFPGKAMSRIALPDDATVLLYAYLFRRLPFKQWFERLPHPLAFRASAGVEKVESFGIADYSGSYAPHEKLRKQITILDYRSDDDFVIQLHADGFEDEIVLAKVAPESTLGRTVDRVQSRIREQSAKPKFPRLVEHESLAIPVIDMNLIHRSSDLVGREILNPGWKGTRIGPQMTRIQFRLDETGAVVEMEETLEALGPQPPPPRHFTFDRPFLVYLQMPSASLPYFAAWIENSEVLERAHSSLD
jgi:hypothetical protein